MLAVDAERGVSSCRGCGATRSLEGACAADADADAPTRGRDAVLEPPPTRAHARCAVRRAALAEHSITYVGKPEARPVNTAAAPASRSRQTGPCLCLAACVASRRAVRRCNASGREPPPAQVFLQRFGIEPILPNGERVSSLQTDAVRERATASSRRDSARTRLSRATAHAARRAAQVDEACVSCGHRGLSFYTMQVRSGGGDGRTVCATRQLRTDGAHWARNAAPARPRRTAAISR